VAIGAHPGFFDPDGSGRRKMAMSSSDVEDIVLYQISALDGIVRAEGGSLCHVKPHGALYNMAAKDRRLADAIARAVVGIDATLVLFGMAGSALLEAAESVGLRTASEVFADRAYQADGALVPREQPGAVIDDPNLMVEQAVRLAQDGTVVAQTGETLELRSDTLCLHGDTPGAAELAARLRSRLEAAGVGVLRVGMGA